MSTVIPLHPEFKRCGCGHSFTKGQWDAVPLKGITDCGDGTFLVWRDCVCGSTLAIELSVNVEAEWTELTGVLAQMAGLQMVAQ